MLPAQRRSAELQHNSSVLLGQTIAVIALGATCLVLGALVGGPLGVAIVVGDIALIVLGLCYVAG